MSSSDQPIIANIVFNSLTHAQITGFRGTAQSQQIIFRAENLSIHLRISKTKAERVILGQLLPQTPGGVASDTKVSLVFGAEKKQTTANSLGEFRFGSVPAGAITLEMEIPSGPRLIANFKVIGD